MQILTNRTFVLKRTEDKSGISGVGIVAEGVEFSNGKCVVSWLIGHRPLVTYDNIEELIAIHGHDEKIIVVFDDELEK